MNEPEFQGQLQLLVDGELDHHSRCQFLNAIPTGSHHWQQTARAFIERQVVDEALNGATIETKLTATVGTAYRESTQPADFQRSEQVVSRTKRSRLFDSVWWAALGASLFLGFASGLVWSSRTSAIVKAERSIVAHDDANRDRQVTQSKDAEDKLLLADALARSSQPIPIEFRRELLKRGYLITELDQLSKVELPTGQMVEMPVRSVAVRYLGTSAYQ